MPAPDPVPKPRGYAWHDEREVVEHAAKLEGVTAYQLATAVGDAKYLAAPKVNDRTGVGDIVEAYFGIPKNSRKGADIENLGIEIKSIPLKMRKRKQDMSVKEPTSITAIDFRGLLKETWDNTPLRQKMARILFVPYLHDYTSRHGHIFRVGFPWSPPREEEPIMRDDYQRVWDAVERAEAHLISESWSLILGARRKGEKGSEVPQPKPGPTALQRAWALRAAYTNLVVQQIHFGNPVVSILDTAAAKRAAKAQAKIKRGPARTLEAVHSMRDVMPFVQFRLGEFQGWTLDEIAKEIPGARISSAKSGPSDFVRRVLGVKTKGLVEEFEKLGIRIHTVTVEQGKLNEGVSFPAMRLQEFVQEEWPTSIFKDHVDRILFIPLHGAGNLRGKRVLGKAFLWEPTDHEMSGIEDEWHRLQRETESGAAVLKRKPGSKKWLSGYTPESRSDFIHIRPKATKQTPPDIDPLGNKVRQRCLWLNKDFVEDILQRNTAERVPQKSKNAQRLERRRQDLNL